MPLPPLYYRWVYHVPTKDVSISHNSGTPAYFNELTSEYLDGEVLSGTAFRNGQGWRVIDVTNKPVQNYVTQAVEDEIRRSESISKRSYSDVSSYAKWAWIESLPVRKWEDSEYNIDNVEEYAYDDGRDSDEMYQEVSDFGVQERLSLQAHFQSLIDLALQHPQLAKSFPTDITWNQNQLVYNALVESGLKFAVGTMNLGEQIQVGVCSPNTTDDDIARALGRPHAEVVMPGELVEMIGGIGMGVDNIYDVNDWSID